jgi:hypothetical protein
MIVQGGTVESQASEPAPQRGFQYHWQAERRKRLLVLEQFEGLCIEAAFIGKLANAEIENTVALFETPPQRVVDGDQTWGA